MAAHCALCRFPTPGTSYITNILSGLLRLAVGVVGATCTDFSGGMDGTCIRLFRKLPPCSAINVAMPAPQRDAGSPWHGFTRTELLRAAGHRKINTGPGTLSGRTPSPRHYDCTHNPNTSTHDQNRPLTPSVCSWSLYTFVVFYFRAKARRASSYDDEASKRLHATVPKGEGVTNIFVRVLGRPLRRAVAPNALDCE